MRMENLFQFSSSSWNNSSSEYVIIVARAKINIWTTQLIDLYTDNTNSLAVFKYLNLNDGNWFNHFFHPVDSAVQSNGCVEFHIFRGFWRCDPCEFDAVNPISVHFLMSNGIL